MPEPMIIPTDLTVQGTVAATTIVPSSASVGDAQVKSGAAIAASKLIHQHQITHINEDSGVDATAETRVIHVARGAGTIEEVRAGSVVAATGDSTVTIDVHKNGTTILSSTIVLDNANTARTSENGTLSVTSIADDDVLEVVITVSPGTGTLPQGAYVTVTTREAAGS